MRAELNHFVALDAAGADIGIVRRIEHGPERGWWLWSDDSRPPRAAAQHPAIRHDRNPRRGGEGARGTLAALPALLQDRGLTHVIRAADLRLLWRGPETRKLRTGAALIDPNAIRRPFYCLSPPGARILPVPAHVRLRFHLLGDACAALLMSCDSRGPRLDS